MTKVTISVIPEMIIPDWPNMGFKQLTGPFSISHKTSWRHFFCADWPLIICKHLISGPLKEQHTAWPFF